MKNSSGFLCTLILLTSLFSSLSCTCQRDDSQKSVEEAIIRSVEIDNQLMDKFEQSKLIFYSLPSPMETAMLIKRSGSTFDPDLLNPTANASRYISNLKMALNLGVYSANMSYASLFEQTQVTLNYMAVSRQLAERLGLMEAIDEEIFGRLEANLNDRDAVMDIISEVFMNSNAYLTEQERPALATMVLVGGWIEGLYLATQLTNGSRSFNPELTDRIAYQKMSMQTVLSMLDAYQENADISYLIERMNELKVAFDRVKIISKSPVEATTDADQQLTVLRSDSAIEVSEEDFRALVEMVREIRFEFIS